MSMSMKAARVNAGLLQKEAAKRLGVDAATIAKWEMGKTYPTVDKFLQLCELYGCKADDIFLPSK